MNWLRTIFAVLLAAVLLGSSPADAQQDSNAAPVRLEDLGTGKTAEGTLSDSPETSAAREGVSGRTDPNTAPPAATSRPASPPPGPNARPSGPARPERARPLEAGLTTTPPAQPKPDRQATLARMLRRRPPVPVTPPKGIQRPEQTARRGLPPEGQAVIARAGTISKDVTSAWHVITFRNDRFTPYEAPRRLLPNRLLEQVEEVLKVRPEAVFKVSGETTNDGQHAYLMLRRVEVLEDVQLDQRRRNALDEPPPAKPSVESQDNKTPAATTEDVLSEMLKDKPGRAVAVAPAPKRSKEENVESVAPARKLPFNPGRKDIVIDRVVRIVKSKEGPWWEARFESDNTLREPPLRILPGRMLLKAEYLSRILGYSDLQLRVSGEITYYKGKRYLLLRKLIRQRNMGQF